ncbi:MAG: LytTR family transcriptional regulator DNA-binding domain-containing protein [Bacteroidales bacterium]|jgi:two-component system LytT family response regulator
MKEPFKVLIIDDEEPARELIRLFIQPFAEEVSVVGECSNGFEGIKAIQSLHPDLLFLDIQMPKISGFEMLELLDEVPQVIFSTAFDEYAIRAFEHNAVDYLLKPYSAERFEQAVNKALERLRAKQLPDPGIQHMTGGSLPDGQYLERLVVKTGQKVRVISIEEVEYFESEDDYVMICTANGRFMKQITLTYLEEHLSPEEFLRIHRSCIVRINRIVQLEPYDKDTKVLVMQSGKKIHASKSGMKRLKEVLGF